MRDKSSIDLPVVELVPWLEFEGPTWKREYEGDEAPSVYLRKQDGHESRPMGVEEERKNYIRLTKNGSIYFFLK